MEKCIVQLDTALLEHMEALNYFLQDPECKNNKTLIDKEKTIIDVLRKLRVSMIRLLEKEYKIKC